MRFSTWLDTLVTEKGLDTEHLITVEGPSGENIIPLGCVLDAIKATSKREQEGIRTMLVKLDFRNAPILPYFEHLAKAIAQ